MPLPLLKRARATRLPPAWPAAAARIGLGCPFSTRVPVENSGVRFQLGCPSALHSGAHFLPRRVTWRPIGVTWRDVANWGLRPPFVWSRGGGRRPPPVPLQPQPPSSLFLMLPPSEDLRGGGCFVNPLHKTLHKTPATLMLIHEAHPGRERGYNQRRRGVHCPPRW